MVLGFSYQIRYILNFDVDKIDSIEPSVLRGNEEYGFLYVCLILQKCDKAEGEKGQNYTEHALKSIYR